ncbi:MAG: ATP-dependent zinc protease [Acidobacteriota bacterium]
MSAAGAGRGRAHPPVIGWREWIGLPELGIDAIKAKVDTGARSSALHAFDVERFDRDGRPWVRFRVHPVQRDTGVTVDAEAALADERSVRSSVGTAQVRPVIVTPVRLGEDRWPVELTLTNRDVMGFRFLLGRQAIRRRFAVDPGRSYVLGTPPEGNR